MKKVKVNFLGFPGWHLECSAMSVKYLGKKLDIHCGGIDHIPVHHTNEIAQCEAIFKNKWVNYWLHGAFVTVDGGKMSKSLGNFYTLNILKDNNYDPLDFRYLTLGTHYRTPLNFTFEALDNAKNSFNHLKDKILDLKDNLESKGKSRIKNYQNNFLKAINDDLNLPKALAVMWDVIKDSKLGNKEKYSLILDFDKVFGLGLKDVERGKLNKDLKELIKKRENARKAKDWKLADKIRDELKKKGVIIEDTEEGIKWKVL